MAGSWEIREQHKVLCYTLHTDVTTIAWAYGLRNLIIPGQVVGLAGMPFDHARNQAVQICLTNGFDWLFSLDSDVVPPADAILRLLAHNRPVVSGLYCRRSPPHGVPVAIKNGGWLTQFVDNSVVEVDLVGAGCLLVHRSVFERLPPSRPEAGKMWFDWRVDMRGLPGVDESWCLSEDFVWCFPRGTWVLGKQNKRIEDVKVGDRVVTHTGSVQRVTDVSRRIYSGDMIRVVAEHMGEVVSTPNHRFYVKSLRKTGKVYSKTWKNNHFRFGEIGQEMTVTIRQGKWLNTWTEAVSIKEGDWLCVPKPRFTSKGGVDGIRTIALSHYISCRSLTKFPDGTFGYSRTRKSALRLPGTIQITPELCRLLGYYIAEGFTPNNKGGKKTTLCFAFGVTEHEYIQDCQNLLLSCFGAKSTVRQTGEGGVAIIASSKLLGRLFSALCGNGSRNKHFPRFWSRLNKECLSELIRGYWNGDGYHRNREFSMHTVSEQLSRDVQSALLKLGILSGVRESSNQNGLVYTVGMPTAMASRMSTVVKYPANKLDVPNHCIRIKETKKHFLVRVRKVEKILRETEVFNLTVSGTETYTANGVAVHNCRNVREKLGVPILLDTSVKCRHVGMAQAGVGTFVPLESTPVT